MYPLNYVSGHWIQLCPTNLDSRWDTPPPRNYRCSLCNKWGDHFATLCPLNEKEISLTKQRQRYEARLQALPRTPTRDDNSNHQDRRRLTPPPRRRSRSPRDRSRRRGPDIYRPDDAARVWPQNSSGTYQRDIDRNSSSPWAAHERVTRQSTRTEEYPRDYSPASHDRFDTLSIERTSRQAREIHPSKEWPRSSMGPPKPKKDAGEGRLSYENDMFMGDDTSPVTPKRSASSGHKKIDPNESEDEVMADAPLSVKDKPKDTTDELERAKAEADEFLDALAAQLFSDRDQTQLGKACSVSDKTVPTSGAAGRLGDKMAIGGDEDNPTSVESADPHVQKPKFGDEVMSLFENHDNPIIHSKVNRKTASDMMDEAYEPTLILALPVQPYQDI
ncbi:hypothetical protein F5Y13DRAFT_153062 [Hypoxylon sp. FL1857]|nr:hypothetical protein F5Y13DRAFT_153062 [Hypoxylon sp. FL1857]